MAPWNSFARMAMQRIMSDPNVRKSVDKVRQQLQSHPSAQKLSYSVQNTINDLRRRATSAAASAKAGATTNPVNNNSNSNPKTPSNSTSGSSQQSHQGATAGGSGSTNYFQQASAYWEKHKDRIIAFVAANFMGILFFIQFGSQLWHLFISLCKSYFGVEEKPKSRKKKDKNQTQAIAQKPGAVAVGAAAAAGTLTLSLNFDSDVAQAQHNISSPFASDPLSTAFAQSFHYKIGDDTDFQPSLQSQLITGAPQQLQTSSWWSGSSTQPTETMVFDLRH